MTLLKTARAPWVGIVIALPGLIMFTYVLLLYTVHWLGWLPYIPWFSNANANQELPIHGFFVFLFLEYWFLGGIFTYYKMYYDMDNNRLFIRGMGFFIPYKQYIPLDGVTGITISKGRGFTSEGYWVELQKEEGKETAIRKVYSKKEALELAGKLSELTGQPVIET